MESSETPTNQSEPEVGPHGKPRTGKVSVPLAWEDYQVIKGRFPDLVWNDEDQSYITKKGTKSYARKLFYFKPLTLEQIAKGREVKAERLSTGWEKFLQQIQNGVRLAEAARRCGFTYTSVKNRLRDDPEFRERFLDAEAQASEPVEDALFDAAINGNVPAAVKWLEKRSPDRWPGDKVQIEQKNVYELDASDRIGNIIALMARLQQRAELDAGHAVIDVESSEPELDR